MHRRLRVCDGREQREAAFPDQRTELHPLQDVWYQGPEPEHQLGHAGAGRRARLLGHVKATETRRPLPLSTPSLLPLYPLSTSSLLLNGSGLTFAHRHNANYFISFFPLTSINQSIDWSSIHLQHLYFDAAFSWLCSNATNIISCSVGERVLKSYNKWFWTLAWTQRGRHPR